MSFGLLIGLLFLLASPMHAVAQGTASGKPAAAASSAQDAGLIYVPPKRGSPGARVSGATRGVAPDSNSAYAGNAVRVFALAPDHVGLTEQEQPTLYWFASRTLPDGAELEITADGTGKTLLRTTLPGPIAAGINAIPLTGTAARLATGTVYTWTVTAIVSRTDPMKNEVTSSQIERISSMHLLTRPPPPGDAYATASFYAHAGVWYDAIDALSKGLQTSPSDARLHKSRAALLAQVGLSAVAAADSAAAR
jgi:hypothetical protein